MSHFADHSDPDADDFARAESDRDAARQEVSRLRAALEAREAEVKYLRAQRAWQVAADRHTGWGSVGIITKEWLAANPEPQPPEGVKP